MATLTAVYLTDLGRVRLTAADLVDSVEYTIQRSTELESAWIDVRGGVVSTDGVTVVDDYEYTPNMMNFYRLTGPIFYDSFARVYPAPIEEGFETLPLDITVTEGVSPGVRLLMPPDDDETSYVSTPDAAALDITGDIDIRSDLIGFDFSSENALVSKMGSTSGSYSYSFGVDNGGLLRFRASTSGTSVNINTVSTVNLYTVGYRDFQRIQVRATRASATGVVTFYYSTDDDVDSSSWIQLGATVTAATGNIFASTTPMWVGMDGNDFLDPMKGNLFQVQVRNGINGTIVANPDFGAQAVGATTFADSAGRTWTLHGLAAIVDIVQSSAPWARTTAQAHTGTWSLQSGDIGDYEVSDATVDIPLGATTLQFWYRVDSESGFDYLFFLVDDTVQFTSSGVVGWTQSTIFDVSSASAITFRYFKDFSSSSGSDAAWVDDLVFGLAATSGTSWGTADTGQVYTTATLDTNASAYVDSGYGVIADPDPVADVAELLADTAPSGTDAEVTYSAVQPAADLDVITEYNIGLRASDNSNYYESQLVFWNDNTVRLRVSKHVGGTFTSLSSYAVLGAWTANTPWYARFRVQSSTLQARAWASGEDEPSTWQASATDSDLTTGTMLHIRGRKNGGDAYEQRFGTIAVTAIPAVALASATVTPVQTEVYLKSVQYPSLNRVLECVDWDELSRSSRVGLYDIKGRHEILAITDVGSSAEFSVTLVTRSKAENRGLVALLTYGGVLLMQPPGDDDTIGCNFDYSGIPGGYVVPGNSTQTHALHGRAVWAWTIPLTRVSAPSDDITPATITWQQLWDIIGPEGTWEDVWATWPTWQALWDTTGDTESFFTN